MRIFESLQWDVPAGLNETTTTTTTTFNTMWTAPYTHFSLFFDNASHHKQYWLTSLPWWGTPSGLFQNPNVNSYLIIMSTASPSASILTSTTHSALGSSINTNSTATTVIPASRYPSSPGLRVPSNRKTIYDRNLNRTRTAELSRASFAYLFSEMVGYAQRKVTGIQDLERR